MFDTICIVGVGLIGGSLGLAVRERGLAKRIVGVARREEVQREAVRLGAVDDATDDVIAAVRNADLVFLATPVGAMRSVCEQIAPHVRDGALITDGGSVKAQVVRECTPLFKIGPRREQGYFIGGHPMAGSEQSGVAAARADLFQGATWVITHTPQTIRHASLQMKELTSALGARPIVMSPEEHDEIVAVTSHLPHLTAAALVHLFAHAPENAAQLVANGWRDSTRVAAGDAQMWRDIALQNAPALTQTLDDFIVELQELRARVAAQDGEELYRWFDAAARVRREQSA